jgi:hypothetical protein
MDPKETNFVRAADFQAAFVAASYFWGARGAELHRALQGVGVRTATSKLLAALSSPERGERARALAAELARVGSALRARSLLP